MNAGFIPYAADAGRSTRFYGAALGAAPTLEVPGRTESGRDGDA